MSDVDPPRAVSEDHLEELLPLAKMMMVEEVSKQLGADAPPEMVVQVEVDMSPHQDSNKNKHKFVQKDAKVEVLDIIMKYSMLFCRIE